MKKNIIYIMAPGVIFVSIWSIFAYVNKEGFLLPYPKAVFFDIIQWGKNNTLWIDIAASITRVFTGFFYGLIFALILGILTGVVKWMKISFDPIVELLRPIPPLAWIPLSILWFGIGDDAAKFLVSLGAFFPIYSGIRRGINSIERYTHETAQIFEISLSRFVLEIALPQSMPSIINSLIVGFGVSWMIVVTAELVGVSSGLGYSIQIARLQLDVERVVSGMIVIGAIGFIITSSMKCVEKILCPWSKGL